jgi:uncharacterized protein (DUF1501 family)
MTGHLSRRSALQLMAAGVTLAAVADPVAAAAASAEPHLAAPAPGVALLVYLGGGNDQLNTLVPVGDGRYFDYRKSLALQPSQMFDLGGGWALNNSLVNVKHLWNQGKVAFHQGVGIPNRSLSHFESAATWMTARNDGDRTTGWLGRFLDTIASDFPLAGVALGSSVPLLLRGATQQAIALPADLREAVGVQLPATVDASYGRFVEALQRFGDGTYSSAAERVVAANTRGAIEMAAMLRTQYDGLGATTGMARQMGAAARILSSGLGVKVAYVQQAGYDTHAAQASTHRSLLADLDTGIGSFFEQLAPAVRASAVVVVFSEFGRRPLANASGGTDHGTAGDVWILGDGVAGGRRGEPASFDHLDTNGNLTVTADYRAVLGQALRPVLGPSVLSALRPATVVWGSGLSRRF